jgi:DNA-binding NtrC family response regulator
VLVVERDIELRDSLRDLLREAGYASVGVSDLELAQDVLQHSPCPLVVLVEHGDPRFHTEALVAAATASPGQANPASHAYVLLSTHPDVAPHLRNPYTRHAVPVVALPGDLDRLAGAVEHAARRLQKRSA